MTDANRSNIVLVTVDSLRADHCGCYGYERDTTPTLDAMAEDGVRFERAIAPGPRTPSSVPVFHTGCFMLPLEGEWNWRTRRRRIREHLKRHDTLAERLRRRGYTTIALTTNPWTHGTGFDRGFDEFRELTPDDMTSPPAAFRVLDGVMGLGELGQRYSWPNKREWFVQWQQQYDHIRRAIERARENEPYFLWLFLLDTHQPYVVPRKYREEASGFDVYYGAIQEYRREGDTLTNGEEARLRRAYRDAIRSTDAFIERLRRDLRGDDPLFVFHADHGEAFGEHGTYGHEQRLYEENIRVPMYVHGLGRSDDISVPFSLRRLPALLCALADDEAAPLSEFTAPVVAATTEDDSRWALRGDRWKYLIQGSEQLYDLASDPGEREDLSASSFELIRWFRRLLASVRADQRERHAIRQAVETRAFTETELGGPTP